MEIQVKFQKIPVEISMKNQWKSNGNRVGISNELQMENNWKSSWNSREISIKYQQKSIKNPVEISVRRK